MADNLTVYKNVTAYSTVIGPQWAYIEYGCSHDNPND